ncbi:MAG: DUF1801 domain-containing protein [Vicingaceae bacterium]
MEELKTKPTSVSVEEYVSGIEDQKRRKDCEEVNAMMQKITGDKGRMWGTSIAGFGEYSYKYASGQEGDWMLTGFSSRKQNLTLYIMSGFKKHDSIIKKLGKFKTGKSCLYIKSLDDIDRDVLYKLISESVNYLNKGSIPNYT